ncbi:PREDICTED: uncharacterized protein LOC109193674 [Ipomoea nil]|uniref:uncharacterized protein LOC109193674 n=1 Tax=Ipomoea nil TaxID=35883 RepID=UPI000900BC36|nr:PREDICTED: uncharacterized protein LOC109193674 [Ipomoea nil]
MSQSSERTVSAGGSPSSATANPLAGAHHHVSMKLNSRNFLFWRTQLVPFLRGQDLLGYVDSSTPCPPATVAAASDSGSGTMPATWMVPNPAHKAWVLQDQSILSMLISSMSDEVLHLVVGRETAAEVWSSIVTALGSSTQARCLSLLGQFQSLRQGNLSTAEYLGRAEVLVEALAQAGRPLSSSEQMLYVLRGLRQDLRVMAASLTATTNTVSLPQLADFLSAQEFIISDEYSVGDNGGQHTAMYAGRGRGSNNDGGRQSGSGQHWRGGRNSNSRNGRGRGGQNGCGPPRCQICRAQGHTAVYCFKRYTMQPPAEAHVATATGELPMTPSATSSDGWYPDTGATAHATPDASMMSRSDEYTGPDVLRVGNGAGLAISRVGHASIPSVSKPLNLSNVLHVPSLSVPLLSVNKFTKENSVYFEFHNNCFIVKDSKTRATLLKGPTSGGLYKLPLSHTQFAFVSSRAT